MRKAVLLALILIIIIIALLYFLMPRGPITLDRENDITLSLTNPASSDFLSAKNYIINYRSEDTNWKYNIQKVVFEDAASARNYSDFYMIANRKIISNKESLKIGDFEGYLFNTHNIESGRIDGYGLVLVEGENNLYGFGAEKETLIEVTEWFIEEY
jgi:hypothetical protein